MSEKFKRDAEPKKEVEKMVERAWLFDIDGVITDPREKRVTKEQLFDELIAILGAEEPIALNTGRDLGFAYDKVITPLREKIDKSLMQNLFVVAEKGTLWSTFDKDGRPHENVDKDFSISPEVQEAVKRVVSEKFFDVMFYDETKRTMISIEMNHGVDLDTFNERRMELIEELNDILDNFGVRDDYKIDPTIIATDIQMYDVGKNLGARRVLKWMKEKDVDAKEFICFGDSSSDLAMAEEIYSHGKPVEFVYVGSKEIDDEGDSPFPITNMKDPHESGTLEYLKKNRGVEK